jgi:hypothetical protein
MAADLVPVEPPEGEDVGLSARQISALEQLHALGAGPKLPTDEKYDSNPQIRALQMVYEGRLGGPGRGQGRPGRDERISVQLTQYVRSNLGKKVTKALERALATDAGERINLDAIKLIVDMEHKEAKLQLSEDAADLDNLSKEELVATLYELVNDAQTGQVITATFTEVPTAEEAVAAIDSRERKAEDRRRNATRKRNKRAAKRRPSTSPVASSQRDGDPPGPVGNGTVAPSAGADGRGRTAPDRKASSGPFSQAAIRRAAERRRASRLGQAEPPS